MGSFLHSTGKGTISWVCALTPLPVVDRENATAWTARVDAVTVRSLADEVSWTFEARDDWGADAPHDSPPLDGVLVSPVARAMAPAAAVPSSAASANRCARAAARLGDKL